MADDRDRAEFIRRLVLARVPELTADEIAAAFAGEEPDMTADTLVAIADAVGDAITALEARLDELERALPWRVH